MRTVKSAEERKNEILDVAWQLFSEKGFDNASTNDIINRIGIARGTLYYHFQSKEEILDALVERITHMCINRSREIAQNKSIPLIQRITLAIAALNVEDDAGSEVFEQIHRPQNALLHQKMQEQLLGGIVPILTSLIEEGNESKLFDARYPKEAAEMIIVYSSMAFDELTEFSEEEAATKKKAFLYHTSKILGAKEGSIEEALTDVIK